MSLLAKLREVLQGSSLVEPPVVLSEDAFTSVCSPVLLACPKAVDHFAVRLRDNHSLPLLAELPEAESVKKLPDYLVFLERAGGGVPHVLVSELKSSGVGAAAGKRQVQLGVILSRYLLRIAWFQAGRHGEVENPWISGLICSPQLPATLTLKGSTRPGRISLAKQHDPSTATAIYYAGAVTQLDLQAFFA